MFGIHVDHRGEGNYNGTIVGWDDKKAIKFDENDIFFTDISIQFVYSL